MTPVAAHNRRPKTALMEKSEQRDVLSPVVRKTNQSVCSLSLDSIVKEYLGQQHSYCNVPVSTCPPFDLLTPHRCEEPVVKNLAPVNSTQRLARRQMYWPWGGRQGAKLTRKYIYSRFKPVRTFRWVAFFFLLGAVNVVLLVEGGGWCVARFMNRPNNVWSYFHKSE